MLEVDFRVRRYRVGDLIMTADHAYRVTGVYLGATYDVSMIGLEAVLEGPGNIGAGPITEMLTPQNILSAAIAGGKAIHYRETGL